MSAPDTDPGGVDAAKFDCPARALPLEGAVLRYVDEGEGDPVLMLHGNPTWGFFYRRMIEALRGSHRVIAPDHVGCGRSDKPAQYAYTLRQHAANVETMIDRLNLRGITLVVHDWGGAIGFAAAVRRPELFRRFVVLNTAAFFGRIPLRIRFCRPPLLGEALVRGFNGFSRAALTMAVVHRERMTPEVRAAYLEPYRTYADRRAVLAFVRDIPTSPAQDSFHVIREIETGLARLAGHPMLICWGGRDFCFNDAFLQEWRRRFPKAVVHRFADAGHYVLEDAHERILPLVQAFLRNEA
ncbi:MAG: Haloalkane dehalogenase [Phycisphaerae bacterium]|nr:Haloalkane dehalogenase [Phycisphaerae bacterium]